MTQIEILSRDPVRSLLSGFQLPSPDSHKGQNGRVLIVGGSSLFHSAPFWAAEIASHFVDIVHYASTEENNIIFRQTKKRFHNGIVVSRRDIEAYLREDHAALIGPGLMRGNPLAARGNVTALSFQDILKFRTEPDFTRAITRYVLTEPLGIKKVIDAGALQMMSKEWLAHNQSAVIDTIITPHQIEFSNLFGIQLSAIDLKGKIKAASEAALKYNILILLKAVDDIITNGKTTYIVRGGNAGLTKGGTGDILAGLVTGLFAGNDALSAAVAASVLLKKTADYLFDKKGYWYNNDDILEYLPQVLKNAL